MNYTWNYQPSSGPGGDAAYWSAFPFQFTDNEVIRLRHGLYKNVVMGANAFAKGARRSIRRCSPPPRGPLGLALEVRSKGTFGYGEPVVVELKLAATDTRGTATHGYLHPNDDFATIAIRQPSGRTVLFRPMLRHCADEDREDRVEPTSRSTRAPTSATAVTAVTSSSRAGTRSGPPTSPPTASASSRR